MILCDNGEVEIKSDNDYEKMSPLEDGSDNEVEYSIEGESFAVRRALSVQV